MRRFTKFVVASAITAVALFGMSAARADEVKVGDITVSDVWSRQSPMFTDAAAGFMVIKNGGGDDTLVNATADITPTVQIHEMKMQDDVMKMAEMKDGLPIPAGATVELKPGSYHIMFVGLKTLPKEGEMFKGTLTFAKAGTVDVQFVVKAPMQ